MLRWDIPYINPKNRVNFRTVDHRFLSSSTYLVKNDFRKKWSRQERVAYIKHVHTRYKERGLKWHRQHEAYLRHDVQWHEQNLRNYQIRHHLRIVPLAKLQEGLHSKRKTAVGRSQRTQSQYVSSNPLYRKGRSYTANVRRLQGFLYHLKSTHYKLVGYGRVEFAMYIYTGLACLRWPNASQNDVLNHLKSFVSEVLESKAYHIINADYVINITYGKIKHQLDRFQPYGKYEYLQNKIGIQVRYYIPTTKQIMRVMGFTGNLYETKVDKRYRAKIVRIKRNQTIRKYHKRGWSYGDIARQFNVSKSCVYGVCRK